MVIAIVVDAILIPPTSLYDLPANEASIRVTCRVCGTTKILHREVVIVDRCQFQRSRDWDVFQREIACRSPACDARDIAVEAVAFSDDPLAVRRCRATTLLMNLSLSILSGAAHEAKKDAYDPTAIRLALRVLHPHLILKQFPTYFWLAITNKSDRGGLVRETNVRMRFVTALCRPRAGREYRSEQIRPCTRSTELVISEWHAPRPDDIAGSESGALAPDGK